MSRAITSKPSRHLWQRADWPALTFDAAALTQSLSHARLEQGRLLGLLEAIGLQAGEEVARELWVQPAV